MKALAKTNQGKKPITQEEYVTNKVLTVFTVCLLGVLILMVLERLLNYGTTVMAGFAMQKVLLGIGIVGVLCSLVLLAQERGGKRPTERRIVCGRNVLLVSVIVVLIMSAIGYFGSMPIKGLYVILPVLAVYYLVFHSYSPEFFMIAVDSGVAVGLIWVVRRAQVSANYGFMTYAAVAVMAVLTIAQLIGTANLRGKKGKLDLRGKKVDLHLSQNAYTMLMVTPILMTVLVAAAALASAAGLVCMGAAACYLFITAVYYTVKLM